MSARGDAPASSTKRRAAPIFFVDAIVYDFFSTGLTTTVTTQKKNQVKAPQKKNQTPAPALALSHTSSAKKLTFCRPYRLSGAVTEDDDRSTRRRQCAVVVCAFCDGCAIRFFRLVFLSPAERFCSFFSFFFGPREEEVLHDLIQ